MYAVDTIDAIDEEDEDKYESNLPLISPPAFRNVRSLSYLHPILKLGNDRAIGDKVEKLALCCVGKRNDEQAEDAHLNDQQHEDLRHD